MSEPEPEALPDPSFVLATEVTTPEDAAVAFGGVEALTVLAAPAESRSETLATD